nr:immunoglobulin heavy chain junction region [Mus musculus]
CARRPITTVGDYFDYW